jgi:hypothetical protein
MASKKLRKQVVVMNEKYGRCAVECVKACVGREAKEVMNSSDVIAASEELLRRAEVCEKRCTELCERAGISYVLNQQYMDSFAGATLRALARAYRQGLIVLGIFMVALGAVLFTIGFVLGAPWLMVYSLPLLLIGITLPSVEIITNKNKDRGGGNAET